MSVPYMERKACELLGQPERTRATCFIAHVDHGKTTLSDSLIVSNGIPTYVGRCFLDSRNDEVERGITMKSSVISLLYRSGGEDHVLQLIDTPGHIDCTTQVEVGTSLADHCFLIVDCMEGATVRTQQLISAVKQKKIPVSLIINKIDRLLSKDTINTGFTNVQQIIAMCNEYYGEEVFDMKSTIFASGKENYGLTLRTFKKSIKELTIEQLCTQRGFRTCVLGVLSTLEEIISSENEDRLRRAAEKLNKRYVDAKQFMSTAFPLAPCIFEAVHLSKRRSTEENRTTQLLVTRHTKLNNKLYLLCKVLSGRIEVGQSLYYGRELATVTKIVVPFGIEGCESDRAVQGAVVAVDFDVAIRKHTILKSEEFDLPVQVEQENSLVRVIVTVDVPELVDDIGAIFAEFALLEDGFKFSKLSATEFNVYIEGLVHVGALKYLLPESGWHMSDPVSTYRESYSEEDIIKLPPWFVEWYGAPCECKVHCEPFTETMRSAIDDGDNTELYPEEYGISLHKNELVNELITKSDSHYYRSNVLHAKNASSDLLLAFQIVSDKGPITGSPLINTGFRYEAASCCTRVSDYTRTLCRAFAVSSPSVLISCYRNKIVANIHLLQDVYDVLYKQKAVEINQLDYEEDGNVTLEASVLVQNSFELHHQLLVKTSGRFQMLASKHEFQALKKFYANPIHPIVELRRINGVQTL